MNVPDKSKWSQRWEPHEIEDIKKIYFTIPRAQNMSELSRWRAAEVTYRSDRYNYLRPRRPKQ